MKNYFGKPLAFWKNLWYNGYISGEIGSLRPFCTELMKWRFISNEQKIRLPVL